MKQLLNIYPESYLHVDLQSRMNYLSLESKPLGVRNTVKSLYSGHCRDLDLVSSLVRVAGNYISQTCVIYFCPGFSCCPYYRMSVIAAGVRKARVDCIPILGDPGAVNWSGKNGGESRAGERAPGKLLLANQFHNSFQ